MAEQAKRVGSMNELDTRAICYWQDATGWWVYLPGCGAGRICLHQVEEHADGTITVTPSILMRGHKDGVGTTRHGFLTKGVWNEC